MPDRDVRTIRDLIHYQYAKIIARSALHAPDGTAHDRGLYSFYKAKHSGQKKFYDLIPSLLEKKYLKTIYNCHSCSGTLDQGDMDGDHNLTVLDIDFIIH